jgi:hypothetical protein
MRSRRFQYHSRSIKGLAIRVPLVFMLLFFAGSSSVSAQKNVNYALHANIIYRFTKYIDWPEKQKSGDFIIGVVGETPLHEELKDFISNKFAGKQRIVVKKFSESATSFNCHILFISSEESESMKKIAAATSGTPTLIVSESEGLARKGSCINFIVVNEHLKIEINKNNIDKRNLDIASELLSLGVIVK